MSKVVPKLGPGAATHVLCFPLYNSKSNLQLHNLVQRLRNDEQAARCPQKAFRLPKSFRLPIAKYKFKCSHDVEAASELLHSLDVHQMLRHAATTEATANDISKNESSVKATVIGDGQSHDSLKGWVPPLYISLIGLSSRRRPVIGEIPASIYGISFDFSNRIHFLSDQIVEHFASAGFQEQNSPEEKACDREMSFLRPNLVSNRKAKKSHKMVDESGRKNEKRIRTPYDARGLKAKYKDVVLADNIPLEKLSLLKIAAKQRLEDLETKFC